jgi:hypothetical protein
MCSRIRLLQGTLGGVRCIRNCVAHNAVLLLYLCSSEEWVLRGPLSHRYSQMQLVFTEFRSDTVFLCLDTIRERDFRCHSPDFCERRKQSRKRIFDGRRICAERPGRCQHHRLRNPASAGGDDTKSHGGKDIDVVALRDLKPASAVTDGGKRRARGNECALVDQRIKSSAVASDFEVGFESRKMTSPSTLSAISRTTGSEKAPPTVERPIKTVALICPSHRPDQCVCWNFEVTQQHGSPAERKRLAQDSSPSSLNAEGHLCQ